jgi:tRNA (adenine37-N6)-methyltransferase
MCQSLPPPTEDVPLTVIGVVRSAHTEPENTPIQAALNRAGRGTIEIAEPYREGLAGLDGFGYAWLLTWLHQPGGRQDAGEGKGESRRGRSGLPPLRQVPFLLRRQQREMGIFATRGPRRVNPIGLSLIQLLEVSPEAVLFAGVDVIDGTPVIGIHAVCWQLLQARATPTSVAPPTPLAVPAPLLPSHTGPSRPLFTVVVRRTGQTSRKRARPA